MMQQQQHTGGQQQGGIAPGECVKALEVLTNTLVRQLGLELVDGYKVMLSQAREVVDKARGGEDDLTKTLLLALDAVPNWSQTLLMDVTERIVQKRPSLPSINAANTVAGTQVLFSIRPYDFGDDRGAFDLKAPDLSVVIHHAYMYLAEILSMHIEANGPEVERRVLREMCFDSVREAIDMTIPVNDVIQYLLPDVSQLVAQMNRQFNSHHQQVASATDAAQLASTMIQPSTALDSPIAAAAAAVAIEGGGGGGEEATDEEDDDDEDDGASSTTSAGGGAAATGRSDEDGDGEDDEDDGEDDARARGSSSTGGREGGGGDMYYKQQQRKRDDDTASVSSSSYGSRSNEVVRVSSAKKDSSFV